MTGIFDISKMQNNDPLRDKKIKALEELKKRFEDLKKTDEGSYFISDLYLGNEIMEKYLPEIIKEKWKGDYWEDDKLENEWQERIINAKNESEIEGARMRVSKALRTTGKRLRNDLQKVFLGGEVDSIIRKQVLIEKTYIGAKREWLEVLKKNLNEFEKIASRIDNGSWERKTVISMFRDNFLAQIADCESSIERKKVGSESWKEDQENRAKARLSNILNDLEKCEFCWNPHANNVMVKKRSSDAWPTTIGSFRRELKADIENLNDDYLPAGQKKADLLQELERVIERGINGVSGSKVDDNVSVTSVETDSTSIFDQNEEKEEPTITDDSSVNYSDDSSVKEGLNSPNSGAENDELTKEWRNRYIERIKRYLNSRSIEENELEPENRNWLEKIKATNNLGEMFSIVTEVEIDAKNKKDLKQTAAELDKIIEDVPSLNNEKLTKAFQTLNESLGEKENEVKAERAKKAMMEQDPEKYFESFAKWVEEEERKIEEEKKKLKETDTDSEIEYDEEEKRFLNGQIDDQQKKEQVAKRIEEKINVKRKTWSFWKWLKELREWLKVKAKLLKKNNKVAFDQKKEQIKQEIENKKNSSNSYTQQAYQKNKQQAEALLRELDNISQNNQTVSPNEKGFFRPEVMVPLSIFVAVVLAIVAAVVIRKRKQVKVK